MTTMVHQYKEYDYIIVGAGFFGSVCAERLASSGKKVLILEKRCHIGGNSWSEPDPETGIDVHLYGSHIFHTSNLKVWNYVNQFTSFNQYRHSVWTTYKNRVYSMPINLATINAYYNINLRPSDIADFIDRERGRETYVNPTNLEEQAVSLIGRPLYEAFIKGYTLKQWEKNPLDLPPEIITRLPVRHNYNNRYFDDIFEGIPEKGYGAMFQSMLDHPNITVQLNTDWFDFRHHFTAESPVIYTGAIDQFFDHKYGCLEWRSIEFKREIHQIEDYQGCTVMNYADAEIPYTRIHEFKHYHPENANQNKTVIFKEYSRIKNDSLDPYYPVNTPLNRTMLKKYMDEANQLKGIYFGGRLGSYQYLDMDDTVAAALTFVEGLINA
jgi:UDP-galactopyranose mutase